MEKNRTSIGKCETCGDPSINIVFSYPVNVSIECRCKNKKEMSIKEYLTKIDSNTVNDVKCKKHLKTYVFFCTKCNTNICSLCKNVHKSHGKLITLKTNVFIKPFKDKFNEAKRFINVYLPAIKSKYDSLFKSNNELESNYNKCIEKNKDITNL